MQQLPLLTLSRDKVRIWLSELAVLVSVAESQPHAAYCVFTKGFIHKVNFISRFQPDISGLLQVLQPVEDFIVDSLFPVLTGGSPLGTIERDLVVRFGGLGLPKVTDSDNEHCASEEISCPLSDIIICKKGSTRQEKDPVFEQTAAKL